MISNGQEYDFGWKGKFDLIRLARQIIHVVSNLLILVLNLSDS